MDKKKINRKWILVISILLLIGGITAMTQLKTPFDIFLTKDFTTPSKNDQIAYLKKHEKEMTEAMLDDKVKTIEWDWDSLDIETIGNGTPQGGGLVLTINGRFNHIEDSSFTVGFNLENRKSYPKIDDMTLMQPLRIDGGTKLYE
ncbi:hypothetical protein [Lactococcus ileimucosae]|uniref:hypothetical protein n=1 Tax=Lactococcus ileimucosae TaxID=2941329 RepID=UPI002044A6A4|nr:hypothetical protein [Lactococcus ileimucosae]